MLKSLLLASTLATTLFVAATASAQESGAVFRSGLPFVLLLNAEEEPTSLTAWADIQPSSSSQIGGFFTTQLSAGGGTPPYFFEFSGSQPAGWTISGSTLAGTYTSIGDLAFAVTARDSATPPQTEPVSFSTTVVDAVPLSTSLGGGGFAVNEVVNRSGPAVVGNDGPASFALHSGSLPPGLELAANGAISGTVGAAGATGTAVIRVSDSYSHLDVSFPWSVTAPSAANTLPVGAQFKYGASWSALGDFAALRNGNLTTPVVNTLTVAFVMLDMGSSIEGNTVSVAANHDFTYRIVSSDTLTSVNLWGSTQSYSASSGAMTVNLGTPRSHRYVGIQILSTTGPGGIVGITELRYGKDGVIP